MNNIIKRIKKWFNQFGGDSSEPSLMWLVTLGTIAFTIVIALVTDKFLFTKDVKGYIGNLILFSGILITALALVGLNIYNKSSIDYWVFYRIKKNLKDYKLELLMDIIYDVAMALLFTAFVGFIGGKVLNRLGIINIFSDNNRTFFDGLLSTKFFIIVVIVSLLVLGYNLIKER